MSRAARIDEDLRRELERIARGVGCELLDIKLAGGTFRLVLDHPEGVTLDHCSMVSREASALLDVADFGAGRYVLEVSSPGLDRPLTRPADYTRFRGNLARVTFEEPTTGKAQTIVARLSAFDPDGSIVSLASDDGKATWQLPLTQIRKARLEIEL